MKLIALPIALCFVCLIAVHSSGQVGRYSDSKMYRPHEEPREKKKNSNERDAAPTDPAAISERAVSLPVSVFDESGRFVQGLTRSDFTVFVDDKEIPIAKFGERPEPATVVLVLDVSPSAFREKDGVKNFAKIVLAELPSEFNVAVVEFSSSTKLLCDVTADREKASKAIDKAKGGDGTSIYEAVEVLFREIDPKLPGRKVAVLLSDGVDTTSKSSAYSESLWYAKTSVMSVYTVYMDTESAFAKRGRSLRQPLGVMFPGGIPITRKVWDQKKEYERGRNYLDDLAGLSGSRFVAAEKLNSLATRLGDELKLQYFISFSLPVSVAKPGNVRVRVNKPNLTVQTRGSIW
jgi:VWFA-related protein